MNNDTKLNNLLDVAKRFPTEQSCREFIEQIRWNGKPVCVHCGNTENIYRIKNDTLLRCSACRKNFSVKVGTIFEDSHVELQKWFFAMFIHSGHKKGISSCQLAKDISVTQKTAWFMLQRIRLAMETKSFAKPLSGIVEADETYVGGKYAGKRGRGSENKTPVFGLVERQGEVRTQPVKRVNRETLQGIIRDSVVPATTVMTDEWLAYNGLSDIYTHKVINHGKKEYVNGDIHVNTMENFWSLLKRGIFGIYHHVSDKHLYRYCNEFGFRHNSREITDANRFEMTVSQSEGKRLMYKNLIAK